VPTGVVGEVSRLNVDETIPEEFGVTEAGAKLHVVPLGRPDNT
jgi:hypothetical protein